MKKVILIIFPVFLFLTFLFLKPNTVKAQDLEVTCNGVGSCTLSSTDPLFSISQDNLWYPGKSIDKTLRITNSSTTDSIVISTNTQKYQVDESSCQLDKQLLLSIVGPNFVSWAGSLNDFYNKTSLLQLGDFSPVSSGDYVFTITLSKDTDNACQNRTTSFDLLLNFSGETIVHTPSPTSAITNVSGQVLGASVSAPVCTDIAPKGAPTLISAVGGTNSVTLTWSPAPDPVTYYLVTYGTSPGAQTYGNPNVGGHGTSGYTINGLSGGTTYYFRVRAGNGCMPGSFSNELSANVAGGFIAGPAEGFVQGVLGAQTEQKESESPLITPTPGVKGASCQNNYYWWLPLAIEAVFLAVYLYWLTKKGIKTKQWLVIPFIIAAVSQIAHVVTGCSCTSSIWCSKYIFINLAILLLSTSYGLYKSRRF